MEKVNHTLIARIEYYNGRVKMAYSMKDESNEQFINRLNNNFTYKLNGVKRIKLIEPLDQCYNNRSVNTNKSTVKLDWDKILSRNKG